MHLFRAMPMLAMVFIIYNLIALFTPFIATPIFSVALPSLMTWAPTYGDFIVLLGILILYVEIFKSTQVSSTQIIEHMFSFFLFLAFLFEFLFIKQVGQSSFLFLCFMSGIDIVAGFTISINAGRRDISIQAR